jgi:hypothetical protein
MPPVLFCPGFAALLQDGRFSGQITQNRPEKNISGSKKKVAVRPPIFLKNG